MATKQRNDNPVAGDTVQLRLYTYNANAFADPHQVGDVDIYFLDPTLRTEANPDGRILVESISSDAVTKVETGHYMIELALEDPKYVIGRYLDVWNVTYGSNDPVKREEYRWQVHPNLWYSTEIPLVYDFEFDIRPNRIRQGSKRFLDVDITPNVPRCSDLERYYATLLTAAPISITIAMNCVECMPEEEDLRTVVEDAPVPIYDQGHAYYFLDTTDMPCGIYDVWFTLLLGASTYVSEKQQLQVF